MSEKEDSKEVPSKRWTEDLNIKGYRSEKQINGRIPFEYVRTLKFMSNILPLRV